MYSLIRFKFLLKVVCSIKFYVQKQKKLKIINYLFVESDTIQNISGVNFSNNDIDNNDDNSNDNNCNN